MLMCGERVGGQPFRERGCFRETQNAGHRGPRVKQLIVLGGDLQISLPYPSLMKHFQFLEIRAIFNSFSHICIL